MKKQYISEETINAFVDNQMTLEDKEQVYEQISQDQELNRQVCEMRKVRDMVQLAYRDVPAPAGNASSSSPESNNGLRSLAAGLVLAVGMLFGWQYIQSFSNQSSLQAVAETGHQVASNTHRVLFHLNSDDPSIVSEALKEVEQLMEVYAQRGQKSRVEFVTNGSGLALLRQDTSRHAQYIKRLQQKYPNLTFVACQNTINRLKQEHGITAKLLPGTVVIDSGVAQIMRRQQQGWAYIQV